MPASRRSNRAGPRPPDASRRTAARRGSRALLIAAFVLVAVGGGWLMFGRYRVVVEPGARAVLWWSTATRVLPTGVLKGANVLVITIDTLRADRVGSYGSRRDLTPNLDRLASEGVLVERAYAHVPLTLPSHASILTGEYPFRHGVRDNGSFRVAPGQATLGTLLKRSGYTTGAFVGAFVLDSRFGLNQGFDVYDDRYGVQTTFADFYYLERPAEQVTGPAARWIEAQHGPWFAWIHLFDPHAPYAAPPAYVRAHPGDRYGAEIAYTDATLGAFIERLRAAGRLDHTLVVVTADHGESLGEHGERTHGLFAYDATLRVPLIFWARGVIPPRIARGPVRHVDIVPTIADLVGVTAPAGLDGASARLLLGGAEQDVGPSYFEALDANLTRNWAPLTGVTAGGVKYVELPLPELYDLERDPAEAHNRARAEPQKTSALAAILHRVTAGALPASGTARRPDPETAERLRALGYVTTPASSPKRSFTVADDPKTLVGLDAAFNEALDLYSERDAAASVSRLRAIIAEHPGFAVAYQTLASVLLQMGRPDEALAVADQARQAKAESPALLKKRGQALQALGRLQESVDTLNRALALDATDADLYSVLGVSQARLTRYPAALASFGRAVALAPHDAGIYNNLGTVRLEAGQLDAAASAFGEALRLDPGFALAAHGLGVAELKRHRPDAAIDAWREAVAADPRQFDTLYDLGVLLLDRGRADEARPYLEQFARTAPPERYADDVRRVREMLARRSHS